MCCLNMCLNLKLLKMCPELFIYIIQKALRTRLIISSMLLFAQTLCLCDDIMALESLQPTQIIIEKSSVRKGMFSCLNSVFSTNFVGIR